jgi:CheY-like chemotaxis protein
MKTILMVEDEFAVMESLRNMLKEYNLIEAPDAEQALRLFTQCGRHVDLLVSHVMLPKISGIQIALLLRSEIPYLPVLLTSGYPVSDWTGRDYTDLLRLGSTSVALIATPFQIQGLLNTVRELLGAVPSELARTA